MKLSHEKWELFFDGNDVNKICKYFLNIFLRIIYSSFPLIQAKIKMNPNSWIAPKIIISYEHKRELYKEACNNNNNSTNTVVINCLLCTSPASEY